VTVAGRELIWVPAPRGSGRWPGQSGTPSDSRRANPLRNPCTAVYTALAPNRFKDFRRDADDLIHGVAPQCAIK
jgi:hypothetical protein